MTTVGIVGGGVAGLGAAYALCETDASVTLLERDGAVGGRVATRTRGDCRYDCGANYVKDRDERTASLIRSLGEDGLVDVSDPVWTFDATGTVAEGDDGDDHKWTWEAGIAEFPRRLRDAADATVRTDTHVDRLERDGGAWRIHDADGDAHGPFEYVLLTPPAPRTRDILAKTTWDDDRRDDLQEAAASVDYRPIRTFALHYDAGATYPWYALVNTDAEHAVGWLAREECKRGHVPDGESLLVVQMSPAWSADHADAEADTAASAAADHVADLLDEDDRRDPDWVDDRHWRAALPNAGADADATRAAEDAGLLVAGDWVVGHGRVHAALWSGYEAGKRIAD